MHLNISCGKWWPFCGGLKVFTAVMYESAFDNDLLAQYRKIIITMLPVPATEYHINNIVLSNQVKCHPLKCWSHVYTGPVLGRHCGCRCPGTSGTMQSEKYMFLPIYSVYQWCHVYHFWDHMTSDKMTNEISENFMELIGLTFYLCPDGDKWL